MTAQHMKIPQCERSSLNDSGKRLGRKSTGRKEQRQRERKVKARRQRKLEDRRRERTKLLGERARKKGPDHTQGEKRPRLEQVEGQVDTTTRQEGRRPASMARQRRTTTARNQLRGRLMRRRLLQWICNAWKQNERKSSNQDGETSRTAV